MEGFLNFRIEAGAATIPHARHRGSRRPSLPSPSTATPAPARLLVLSQVVLSLQLAFAVIPLVKFTGERAKMGEFTNPRWVAALAWGAAAIIVVLNVKIYHRLFWPYRVADIAVHIGAVMYQKILVALENSQADKRPAAAHRRIGETPQVEAAAGPRR